jgi:hypothetical protein
MGSERVKILSIKSQEVFKEKLSKIDKKFKIMP